LPHYIYEARLLKTMSGPIAGVDEAGRGPLAGPVVAAAVILDRKRIPRGLNDSKQMTAEAREEAFTKLMLCAVVGVGEASVDEIDLINIRQATHLAMARAVRALPTAAQFALVDGNDPVCRIVAHKIIEIAESGVTNAVAICEIATRELGIPEQ